MGCGQRQGWIFLTRKYFPFAHPGRCNTPCPMTARDCQPSAKIPNSSASDRFGPDYFPMTASTPHIETPRYTASASWAEDYVEAIVAIDRTASAGRWICRPVATSTARPVTHRRRGCTRRIRRNPALPAECELTAAGRRSREKIATQGSNCRSRFSRLSVSANKTQHGQRGHRHQRQATETLEK